MDAGGIRRELALSFRLLAGEELRLFAGFAVGAVGYLVWIAGTGVAVTRLEIVVFDPRSTGLAATFAVVWVLFPALVAVRYVLDNLTNIRGNVEKRYRVDRPLVLLAPPLAALVVTVTAIGVHGSVDAASLLVLGGVNLLLLVRTIAYGYRVYSLSHPWLLRGLLFVAFSVTGLAVAGETAWLANQGPLVAATADRFGAGALVDGTVQWRGLSTPTLSLVGALAPGVAALAYVWAQLFASLVVRLRQPSVPQSEIRPGQRYPTVVQPGTTGRLALGTAPDGSTGGEADEAGGSGPDARQDPSSPDSQSDGSGPDARQDPSSPDDVDAGDGPDDGDSVADRFAQTRVYTPPSDDEATGSDESPQVVGADDAAKRELCPICGDTYLAETDHTHCPNCNAVLDYDR